MTAIDMDALEERWFNAGARFSRERTQELRTTDLIPGNCFDHKLLEVDGLHYREVSLRGARLVPNVPLEALMDSDEPDGEPEPDMSLSLPPTPAARAAQQVAAIFRSSYADATTLARHARSHAKGTPTPVLAAAALGIAPLALLGGLAVAAMASPLMLVLF